MIVCAERGQVVAQSIDDVIERLEWHGLALVAAPTQNQRGRRWRASALHVIEESLDQTSLADPRTALHDDHRQVAFAHLRVGGKESMQLLLAAGNALHRRADRGVPP